MNRSKQGFETQVSEFLKAVALVWSCEGDLEWHGNGIQMKMYRHPVACAR